MSLLYSNPSGGRPGDFTILVEFVDAVTQLNYLRFAGFFGIFSAYIWRIFCRLFFHIFRRFSDITVNGFNIWQELNF